MDAARGVWIRRLIDHSRSNSLSFYRDLTIGTLDLSAETEAVDRLLGGEPMPVESLISEGRYEEDTDPIKRVLESESSQGRRLEIHASLSNAKRCSGSLEEKGIETLFFARGMATWPASDGGRPYEAPVLLIPARIESRGQGGQDSRFEGPRRTPAEPGARFRAGTELRRSHLRRCVLSACTAEDDDGRWRIDPNSVIERVELDGRAIPDFSKSADA